MHNIPQPYHAHVCSRSTTQQLQVSHFIDRLQTFLKNPGTFGHRPPSTHFACGYPIPSLFEITPWDLEQQRIYIESVFLELPMQPILLHKPSIDGRGRAEEYSDLILYGQHQLKAIENFFYGEFSIFNGVLYTNLDPEQRRRFHNVQLRAHLIEINDMHHIDELVAQMALLFGERKI